MTKKMIFMQFRFPKNEVLANLPKDIADKIENKIIGNPSSFLPYSTVELNEGDPIYKELINKNILINGDSLIRLIRENIQLDIEDIKEDNFYEFIFDIEEVKLISDPINYYDVKTECKYCGRNIWTQKKNLEIKKDINTILRITNNYELLVSNKFRDLLIKNDIKNIDFRNTNKDNTSQLILNDVSEIVENPFLIKEGHCKECGRPRIVKYENTNNVNLIIGQTNIPRIEKLAMLELKKATRDISYTNYEFGAIGRIPEGAPPSNNPYDYSFKSSEAKIIISGKLVKLIYQTGYKEFHLIPCK